MNEINFRAFFRGLKATPTAGNAEQLHEEYRLDVRSHLRTASIRETLTLAGASVNMTTQIPKGARVLFTNSRFIGTMVPTTATKIGVGTGASPSAYLLTSATMTDGTTNDAAVADAAAARTTAATTVVVSSVDNAGAAAGTAAGTVEVRVVYQYVESLYV